MSKKVSVVIPTYNSWNTLKDCIKSIKNQSLKPYEVIIIDNASTDNTFNNVKRFFPKIKLIRLENNTGVTGGRNRGIEEASVESEYILFFDHDMKAEAKMLEELVKVAEMNKTTGIITPKIYYSDNKKRIWSAGTGINLWTGQVLFRGGLDRGQFEQIEEVQVAPAVLLVSREVIDILKGFDGRYFATYEDTDFCFRAKQKGFKTFYAPKAQAFHDIPSDSKQEAKRLLTRAYFVGRNRILFMKDFGNNFYIFILFLPIFLIYYLKLALTYGRFTKWFDLVYGIFEGLVIVIFSKKVIFAGERPSLSDIEGLHMAKYKFASLVCKNKGVLEIGCGSGYGTKYIAESGAQKVTAYDIDSKAIDFANKNFSHSNIVFAQGDAETLILNKKYDVILSFEVIEHLNHPEKLLQTVSKSLKKGGVFILSTPNKSYSIMDGDKPSNPYHIYEYYPSELKKLLLKYFKSVDLYGVVLQNKERSKQENALHRSWKWKIINSLTNKRFIRKIVNYLPESPKRLISGESKISFQTEDFAILKNKEDMSSDFIAICR
jgi:GT2 family glycosyltransferase/2-polyprenyl-3-methyl-5-hydroxy-6-metoxy-1,4-benzoquinol methylase